MQTVSVISQEVLTPRTTELLLQPVELTEQDWEYLKLRNITSIFKIQLKSCLKSTESQSIKHVRFADMYGDNCTWGTTSISSSFSIEVTEYAPTYHVELLRPGSTIQKKRRTSLDSVMKIKCK